MIQVVPAGSPQERQRAEYAYAETTRKCCSRRFLSFYPSDVIVLDWLIVFSQFGTVAAEQQGRRSVKFRRHWNW